MPKNPDNISESLLIISEAPKNIISYGVKWVEIPTK